MVAAQLFEPIVIDSAVRRWASLARPCSTKVRNVTANFSRGRWYQPEVGDSNVAADGTDDTHMQPSVCRSLEYERTDPGRDLLVPIHALGAWVDAYGAEVSAALCGGTDV